MGTAEGTGLGGTVDGTGLRVGTLAADRLEAETLGFLPQSRLVSGEIHPIHGVSSRRSGWQVNIGRTDGS